jgi:hypothetical protein
MSAHLHAPRIQAQIIGLAIFLVLGMLLIAYRNERVAADIKTVAYDSCLARQAQAREVNDTRANVGELIIAMVPDAPRSAREAMLAGMTRTQLLYTENCELFRQ